MTNTNSINAYRDEKDSGNITKRQQQVVDFLGLVKGATGRQISKAVPGGWKRVSELCDLGLVRVCGNIKDKDTNKTVAVYELTGQQMLLPTPSVKRPSRKELEEKVNDLEYRNSKLYESNCRMTKEMETMYNKGYHDGVAQCDLEINILKQEVAKYKKQVTQSYYDGIKFGISKNTPKEVKIFGVKIW